jgi:hypothetical protein
MVPSFGDKEGTMVPNGLPAFVARRRRAEVCALSKLDIKGQNELLGILWHSATHATVSRRYLVDLRHITVAFKKLQVESEAAGLAQPH